MPRRRLLLGGAGAAAAAVATAAAVGGTALPAAAADEPLLLNENNGATTATVVTLTSGTGEAAFSGVNEGTGDGINAFAGSGNGMYAQADTGRALWAAATSTGTGILATSAHGIAGRFTSNAVPLSIQPTDGSRPAPTSDASTHAFGDLVVDSQRDLWCCVAGGTPGTWRKLTGPAAAGAFHVLAEPKRIYDSRPGTSPSVGTKAKLAPNVARVLDAKANGSGVPAGATAIMATVLVVDAPAASGNLVVWADGVAKPSANTMVWGGTAGRFSGLAVSAVDASARLQVAANVATDLVVDILGYYR